MSLKKYFYFKNLNLIPYVKNRKFDNLVLIIKKRKVTV